MRSRVNRDVWAMHRGWIVLGRDAISSHGAGTSAERQ